MTRTSWLAALACTTLAATALAQTVGSLHTKDAQPGDDKAAAPKPAAEPANQVAEDAKQLLNDSAKAIKDVKGISFSVKTSATGMLKDIIDLSGEVKIWRPEGSSNVWYLVHGRAKDPGKQDKEIYLMNNGQTVTWLSATRPDGQVENKRYTRPIGDPAASEPLSMCKELILPDWISPTPYSDELGKPILSKTGITNVGGEVCDVVEALQADKSRNRTWAISVKDRLPRSLELGTGNQAQKITKNTEMTGLKVGKFTEKDFDIPLPTSWVDDKIGAPAPPAPQVKVELGLKTGTPAPGFAAKDTDGKEVDISKMKGDVIVLEFWGTVFKPSTEHAAEMRALAAKFDKKVKFVGMACRTDDKVATDWWTKSGPGYSLVLQGDQIASDYKVAGKPSYVVIDTNGNVAAFFQGFPGADKIEGAVRDAMK